MKKTYVFMIISFNILLIYLFVFSSSRNEDLIVQLDNEVQGYQVIASLDDEMISSIYDIADEYNMTIVIKQINKSGLIFQDYEYHVYNFDFIKDKVKYLDNNKITSLSSFSNQKISEVNNNSNLVGGGIYIYANDISPITKYLEDNSEYNYNIYANDEYNIIFVNLVTNGRTIAAFVGLIILSTLFILLTRRKELAFHYVNGKNDFSIINYQFLRLFKLHFIFFLVVNIVPIIYIMSLSLEYGLDYVQYILIGNIFFMLCYLLVSYVTIPLVIRLNNAFELLKGRQVVGMTFSFIKVMVILLTIFELVSLSSVYQKYPEIKYYYDVFNEDILDDLYDLRGLSIGKKYNLTYEDNLEIAEKLYVIENNYYIQDNPSKVFDKETMTVKEKFIRDTVSNYRYMNDNMFNLLNIEDVNGNILTSNEEATIYVPESKYNDVKKRYSEIDNFIKIKDGQQIFIPLDGIREEYYAIDAYYIVEKATIDEEMMKLGYNIYEPNRVNMYFDEEDVQKVHDKYFPNSYIRSIESRYFNKLEEEIILFVNIINSAILIAISLLVCLIIYYSSLYKKYQELLFVNVINGNSILPIILKKNLLINLSILGLIIYCIISGLYIGLVIVLIHAIIIGIMNIKLSRSNYILKLKEN